MPDRINLNDPQNAFAAALRGLSEKGENLSVGSLRALSPLPYNAQIVFDKTVIQVGRSRLTVLNDFLDAGLVYDLPNAMGTPQLRWYRDSDGGGAQRVMTPKAREENEMPQIDWKDLPIYITMGTFSLDVRGLMMSQRAGLPLDVTNIEHTTRRVNEALEDAMINGAGITVAGMTAPGLLNAPNANTQVIAVNWNTATGDQIRTDIMAAITTLQGLKKYGPYNVYVNTAWGLQLTKDFKANGNQSILSRLQEINVGGRNLMIKSADMIPVNKAVVVQMTADVADVVVGQTPVVVPWKSPDNWTYNWAVMSIIVPRVRSDYNNVSGIVVMTGS